jgi:hypothetical protein
MFCVGNGEQIGSRFLTTFYFLYRASTPITLEPLLVEFPSTVSHLPER